MTKAHARSSSLRRADPGVYAWGGSAALLSFQRVACSHHRCRPVSMQQKRASRYRFSPTLEHAAIVARTCGCVRPVSNWALRLRTDAHYERQERVHSADTSAALTVLKQQPETAWLNEVPCVPTQHALRHLERAFRHFFEGRAKYPTFKKKHGHQAAEYTTSAFRRHAQTRAR